MFQPGNNMCLYPTRITNKKYQANEKNGGVIPTLPVIGFDENNQPLYDYRILTVEVPCGRCKECCEKKAREWMVRLGEEIKDYAEKHMYFVTFTFSPEGLREILFKHGITENNAAAGYALRHSLELFRKYNKKSYRHWFITELGHQGTERIHMHGILFMDEEQKFEKIEQKKDGWMCKWRYWKYGHIFVGNYVNQQSVNYVVKYMNKIDTDHKTFVGQILCSPGIGRRWINHLIETGQHSYTYRPRNTRDYYRLNNGSKIQLPKYYANKLFDEEERELMWREKLDLQQEIVAGHIYDSKIVDIATMGRITAKAQEINKSLDFGDNSKEWRKQPSNITKRMLQSQERQKRMQEMMSALGIDPDTTNGQRMIAKMAANKKKMKKEKKNLHISK